MKSASHRRSFDVHWQENLSDYVTAISWSKDGNLLAACSAAGEVLVWQDIEEQSFLLQSPGDTSTDCLNFSYDGQFLAAGGQDGVLRIWSTNSLKLVAELENSRRWIDQLAWHPSYNQVAFSLGKKVQIWDAESRSAIAELNFENSSIFGIAWHPQGKHLAASGSKGVKIWNALRWDEVPRRLEIPSASGAIAWSGDGQRIAVANLDDNIAIAKLSDLKPGFMGGFPGKIRKLAWSDINTELGVPLIAVASGNVVGILEKQFDESAGWDGWVLDSDLDIVQDIAFQPGTFHLASASDDGQVLLWYEAEQLAQLLTGASGGFSCLAWHPQGYKLAAGGQGGEVLIWKRDDSEV